MPQDLFYNIPVVHEETVLTDSHEMITEESTTWSPSKYFLNVQFISIIHVVTYSIFSALLINHLF